jgi:hypothetical protein
LVVVLLLCFFASPFLRFCAALRYFAPSLLPHRDEAACVAVAPASRDARSCTIETTWRADSKAPAIQPLVQVR